MFEVTSEYDMDSNEDAQIEIIRGMTDWEEISIKDYEFLQQNISKLYCFKKKYSVRPLLIAQPDPSYMIEVFTSIQALVAKEKEAAAKAAANRRKSAQKKAVKKKMEEKELLEQLKKRYE